MVAKEKIDYIYYGALAPSINNAKTISSINNRSVPIKLSSNKITHRVYDIKLRLWWVRVILLDITVYRPTYTLTERHENRSLAFWSCITSSSGDNPRTFEFGSANLTRYRVGCFSGIGVYFATISLTSQTFELCPRRTQGSYTAIEMLMTPGLHKYIQGTCRSGSDLVIPEYWGISTGEGDLWPPVIITN